MRTNKNFNKTNDLIKEFLYKSLSVHECDTCRFLSELNERGYIKRNGYWGCTYCKNYSNWEISASFCDKLVDGILNIQDDILQLQRSKPLIETDEWLNGACPNCGRQIQAMLDDLGYSCLQGLKYCPFCGQKVITNEQSISKHQTTRTPHILI